MNHTILILEPPFSQEKFATRLTTMRSLSYRVGRNDNIAMPVATMWDVANSDATGTMGAPEPGTFPAGEGNRADEQVHPCPGAPSELCQNVKVRKSRDPDLDVLREGSYLPSDMKGHTEDQISALLPKFNPLGTIQASEASIIRCQQGLMAEAMLHGVGSALGADLPGKDPKADAASAVRDVAKNPLVRTGAAVMAANIAKQFLTRASAGRLGVLVGEKGVFRSLDRLATAYLAYSALKDASSYYDERAGSCP